MKKNVILLIENNILVKDNISEILLMSGYKVATAENVKIGFKKALVDIPELVICDIETANVDSLGVLRIFKSNPELSTIPFILLTAKSERNYFREAMEYGADDYITKPFAISELLRAIDSQLKKAKLLKEGNSSSHKESPKKQAKDIQSLIANRKIHFVKKKQYIYMNGEDSSRVYYLKSGNIKTVLFNTHGKELITEIYQSGDFFGYIFPLDQKTYNDSAITLTNCELIYIPNADFHEAIMNNYDLNEKFIKQLTARIKARDQQLLIMAYDSLRSRIAYILLQIQVYQTNTNIKFTREDLAGMVGAANESLIRILSEFRNDGLIEITSSGGINILNKKKLQNARW